VDLEQGRHRQPRICPVLDVVVVAADQAALALQVTGRAAVVAQVGDQRPLAVERCGARLGQDQRGHLGGVLRRDHRIAGVAVAASGDERNTAKQVRHGGALDHAERLAAAQAAADADDHDPLAVGRRRGLLDLDQR
jgi:hypothetical protein